MTSKRVNRNSKFAEQVDERHLSDRVDRRTRDARICHDDGKTLCPGHGDVDPVTVEDKPKSAGPVFAVTGTERQDANRSFLPLELVNATNAGICGKGGIQGSHLGIVRSDEEEILQAQRFCRPVLRGVRASV